jgi:hypothetical protein
MTTSTLQLVLFLSLIAALTVFSNTQNVFGALPTINSITVNPDDSVDLVCTDPGTVVTGRQVRIDDAAGFLTTSDVTVGAAGDLTSIICDGATTNNISFAGNYNDFDVINFRLRIIDPPDLAPLSRVDTTFIVADNTNPTLTLLGNDPETVLITNPYVDAGATVSDNDVTVDGSTIACDDSAVDVNTIGSYIVTCDFTDPSGNPADQITRTVDVTGGPSDLIMVGLRDISDLSPNVPPTFSLDPAEPIVGSMASLLVTDMNANYDPNNMDSEVALVNGNTVPLTENDIDSAVFVGSFEALAENTGDYNQPLPLARATATLEVSQGGDATLNDGILLDDLTIDGLCFRPVVQPIDLVPVGVTTIVDGSVQVTISYANAVFVEGDTAEFLDMYYLASGSASWEKVVDFGGDFDIDSRDFDAMTITSDVEDTVFGMNGGIISAGQYVLGFDVGCGGGGAGAIGKSGFVVNAVAGLSVFGSGGGGGNSPPSFGTSSFAIIEGGEEGFGGILNDNDATTLDQTKTFKVGEKAVLRFDFTEGGGIGKIEHIGLYANVRDGQKRQDSDAYIYFDPLKSPQVTVHDPNGLFSEANFELLQEDVTKFVLKYDLTFAKPMAKSDLILESWNTKKWSSINKIPNAIEVLSSGILQEGESEEPVVETFLEDVTDDQVIPVWVKSNAKWWSDGTIDNDTFISGIEHLVNEGVIKVSMQETNAASVSDVQPWIKNTAGWWADGMISEDEFVTAIEWLITNNIIEVAA